MFRLPRSLVLSLLCFTAAGGVAQAADYPTRPVKCKAHPSKINMASSGSGTSGAKVE